MIDNKLLESIFSKKQFIHLNKIINPNFISWEVVSDYFIPPTTRNVEVIGSEGKIEIPKKGIYQDRDYILKHISQNCSFCVTKFINPNAKTFELFEEFCDVFPEKSIDFHLYGGLNSSSNHFSAHNDLADNFIIHLDGQCEWTIYKEQASYDEALNYKRIDESKLSIQYQEIVNPGDILFIPSSKYHKCVPLSKRLSLSVPIL